MFYSTVVKQHKYFKTFYEGPPRHLSIEEKQFYLSAFKEETSEYFQALNLEGEMDALLDLLIFTIGAYIRHGFDPDAITEVVRANMDKIPGQLKKRNDFKLDLIKPVGWRAPDLKRFL